jgi:predicted transcriptional regulator
LVPWCLVLETVTEIQRHLAALTTTAAPDSKTTKRTRKPYQRHHCEPETFDLRGELMADKKIGCVPVTDDRRLVGLVTTTDILRYVEGLE